MRMQPSRDAKKGPTPMVDPFSRTAWQVQPPASC